MRVQQTTIGPVMLTLVGRQQLGLKYVLPEMCEESRRGFAPAPERGMRDVLRALAAKIDRGSK